jgi:hypothetical protein
VIEKREMALLLVDTFLSPLSRVLPQAVACSCYGSCWPSIELMAKEKKKKWRGGYGGG